MEKIIILGKGINGHTSYSIFRGEKAEPVVTNKPLTEISKEFARIYPEISLGLKKHFENFSEEIPKGIEISGLEPRARFDFIESVSIQVQKQKK